MAILSKGQTFSTGDSPTATQVNNLVDLATFTSGAVDSSTTTLSGGAIIVKDGGITPAKLSTGGPTWTSAGLLTASELKSTPVGATGQSTGSFTTLSANSTTSIYEVVEKATISSSAFTGTVNYNFLDGSVILATTSASGNWTLNIRGNGTTSLNSTLSVGDSITLVTAVTQGTTAYYASALQIDGSSVTPKWASGTAPTAGNASSIDVYCYTVIKTASATYTVLASQTKFA
jgi:hypothetical protein